MSFPANFFPESQMNNTIQDQIIDKIFTLVRIKSEALRYIQYVIVENHFVSFLEKIEDFETFVGETKFLTYLPSSFQQSSVKRGLKFLKKDHEKYLHNLARHREHIETIKDDDKLLEFIFETIDR